MDWRANLKLPPRHDRRLWQLEQDEAARQAREQQEAAARHQEEQEAAARHQEQQEAAARLGQAREQEAAARHAREQEAAARHQEEQEAAARQAREQEAAARHQEEVARQARAQEEVERVLNMAMNQGNWLRNQAGRIPRLKKAIAAAELSGLPSIRNLLRRAKIVLSLEEGGAQSRAAHDEAVRDNFHHCAVTTWWQKEQARREQARREQARKEQRVALEEQLERADQREADIRQAALDWEAEQQRGRKRRWESKNLGGGPRVHAEAQSSQCARATPIEPPLALKLRTNLPRTSRHERRTRSSWLSSRRAMRNSPGCGPSSQPFAPWRRAAGVCSEPSGTCWRQAVRTHAHANPTRAHVCLRACV